MSRRREPTVLPPSSSMGFKDRRKAGSRSNGFKPSSIVDADASASTPPTTISVSSSSSGASKNAPCSHVRLLHDEEDSRLPLSHAGRIPPESTHFSRRSSCNDALPTARRDGRGDARPNIRRMKSDHIGGSFQRRPTSRSRGEASGRRGRPPIRSFSPSVSGFGRHPQSQGRHTSKERNRSMRTRDISRHRSASTGKPISRGRFAASNGHPALSIRPPSTSRGRRASNLRPVMNSGGGRSCSQGRDRSPPAYADSKALILRRRSMSPPHRDPRGENGRSHSCQPPSDTRALVVRRRTVSPKSNWQSISNGCPPHKRRSASNLRPSTNSGKGRSRSRERASLVRRQEVKVDPNPLSDPLGRRPRRLRSRRPPSMENSLVVYKPNRGRQSSSRTHPRQTNSAVPSLRVRSSESEAATRSPSRSRSIAPGVVYDSQNNSIHTAPRMRSDLVGRSSSRSMTRQERDISLERIILSTMMRTLSIDSCEEKPSRRPDNSIDRRLPDWSDVNSHTRSKTDDLSKLSQQVSTSTRRNSSPRPRSPSSGRRIREESSERTQSETIRRNVSLDSFCEEAPRRREHSSVSQGIGLSVRSQKTSASSTIISYCPRASIEKRSPDRSSDKSQPCRVQIRHGNRRANEQKQDACVSMSKVAKKTQGDNLPRVNSAEEVQSRPKPLYSSMKALPPISDATPPVSETSPPVLEVSSFDKRHPRASATVNGHSISSNNIADPLSHGDLSPSGDTLRYPRSSTANTLPRTTPHYPGSSAPNLTPPPPPPRKQTPPPPPPPRTNDASNNMHNGMNTTTLSQLFSQEVMSVQQHPPQQPELMMGVQPHLDCQYREAPAVGKSKEWMKYSTKGSRREIIEDESEKGKRSKLFGRGARKKSGKNEQIKHCNVKKMPFTDQFGDFGYYTGQVDDEGRPNGKGAMKYENGVFYEGTWVNGSQDKLAASQHDRIRSGFTSWSGKGKGGTKSGSTLPWNAHKNDAFDGREKTNVRGLDWTDLNGGSGRYTGEVDNDQLPHGSGIMRYDYGLIAEGEWVHGVLKEGPHDRMISAAAMNGGQSDTPGMPINCGMSVGPGAIGYAGGAISVLGVGGMSVAPPVGFTGGMTLPLANPMQFRGMNASQHAMLAHQNAMMKMHCGADVGVHGGGGGGGGSVYHGGNGSVYGGTCMVMPMQQMPQMFIQPMQHVELQQQNQQQQQNHRPPISSIVI